MRISVSQIHEQTAKLTPNRENTYNLLFFMSLSTTYHKFICLRVECNRNAFRWYQPVQLAAISAAWNGDLPRV
jgi:hypothetical protein